VNPADVDDLPVFRCPRCLLSVPSEVIAPIPADQSALVLCVPCDQMWRVSIFWQGPATMLAAVPQDGWWPSRTVPLTKTELAILAAGLDRTGAVQKMQDLMEFDRDADSWEVRLHAVEDPEEDA
jgi:hypothetical protein